MRVDEIRREVTLDADIENVWKAITEPEQIAAWFGDSAEIDLKPGGKAVFGWSEYDDVVAAVVEKVEQPTRFSFRWEAIRDTPLETASTLVEFTLTPTDSGTLLTLVESGFSHLPPEIYEERLAENTSGWNVELEHLTEYILRVRSLG